MMADGGFFPQGVKVVVVRVVLAEMADTSAVLLLLPGGPSLVAALAARRRRLDGFLVQRRPAGLTNLESPVVLEGALLTRDDVTAAAVGDVVEAVRGCAAGDAVGRGRGRRQRRVPALAAHLTDVDPGLVQVRAGVALPPRGGGR